MKFIRVNMTNQTIHVEEVSQTYLGLGGRGLTSIMINTEVPPTCDPLGPENKLIFAPGLLSGTTLVNTSRISIGAKSPLTGGIKESNAGGTVAETLARSGIAAVIVEGQPSEDECYLLKIEADGGAVMESAQAYKGMRTYALTEKLFQAYGKKNSILCIGPAGEFRLKSASIQTTDVDGRPCRAAGRGGLGAVMGSKGLKAIVVSQQNKMAVKLSDPKVFKEASKIFVKLIKENPFTGKLLPELGTAALVGIMNSFGAFPAYNSTQGVFDAWENISGETLAEIIKERGGKTTHLGCSQCIIHCSNEYVDQRGEHVTSSLEYETIWSMGGMLGIDDLDVIAHLDFLADDIGLDTMNTGVAIAVTMDAGNKEFGDGQAAIELMKEIADGTEFGKILGNGPASVGKHFNHHRVPAVKGQSIAAYDPRGMQGMGVTYATSTMGADHTAGGLIGAYTTGKLDPLKVEGQVEASRNAQITMAFLDSTGLCLFAGIVLTEPEAVEALLKMINIRSGSRLGPQYIQTIGVRVLKAEREFNKNAGLTQKDDRLPRFFYEELLPPHNKTFLISDEEMDGIFEF